MLDNSLQTVWSLGWLIVALLYFRVLFFAFEKAEGKIKMNPLLPPSNINQHMCISFSFGKCMVVDLITLVQKASHVYSG